MALIAAGLEACEPGGRARWLGHVDAPIGSHPARFRGSTADGSPRARSAVGSHAQARIDIASRRTLRRWAALVRRIMTGN